MLWLITPRTSCNRKRMRLLHLCVCVCDNNVLKLSTPETTLSSPFLLWLSSTLEGGLRDSRCLASSCPSTVRVFSGCPTKTSTEINTMSIRYANNICALIGTASYGGNLCTASFSGSTPQLFVSKVEPGIRNKANDKSTVKVRYVLIPFTV